MVWPPSVKVPLSWVVSPKTASTSCDDTADNKRD